MNKKVCKFIFFAVLAASVTVISGCKSKNSAEMYGSDGGLYGGEILDGDMPLNDTMGLPSDGDRSMFAPVMFAYDSSQVNPEEAGKVAEDVVAKMRTQIIAQTPAGGKRTRLMKDLDRFERRLAEAIQAGDRVAESRASRALGRVVSRQGDAAGLGECGHTI